MQVLKAFQILTSDKQVKAILVNIFGELAASSNCQLRLIEHPPQALQGCTEPALSKADLASCEAQLPFGVSLAALNHDPALVHEDIALTAGGIMKCDVIAQGIVNAAKQVRRSSALAVFLFPFW